MNLEKLQSDCRIKANNLKTALESASIDNFQSIFLLKNYLECKNESIAAVEKLIKSLEKPD